VLFYHTPAPVPPGKAPGTPLAVAPGMVDPLEARQGLLPLNQIVPRADQPRAAFDGDTLDELKDSIRAHGILEPLVVRPLGGKFEIVCGERRYRAACELALPHVPVRALDLDDDRAFIVAIHENVHRDSLTPIEEARAYERLIRSGRAASQRDLSKLLNVSQARISQRLALLRMPANVIEGLSVPDSGLTERHARILRQLENDRSQADLAHRIMTERLSVDQTAVIVSASSARRPRRCGAHRGWLAERGYRWRQSDGGLEVHIMNDDPVDQVRLLRTLARRLERQLSAGAEAAPEASDPDPCTPSTASPGSDRPGRASSPPKRSRAAARGSAAAPPCG
jgi:ParB/RepB/Spo0J family partition protein